MACSASVLPGSSGFCEESLKAVSHPAVDVVILPELPKKGVIVNPCKDITAYLGRPVVIDLVADDRSKVSIVVGRRVVGKQ